MSNWAAGRSPSASCEATTYAATSCICSSISRPGSRTRTASRNVDDHLRNHGFLWRGGTGWTLSPAYDLNPVPADLKARVLTTNIDLDEGTCSVDLLQSACRYFGLKLTRAREVIKSVAEVTATWRSCARAAGARAAEIDRMASAFEHEELNHAREL